MRKYGLIGYPLSHSFSQKYFTEKFGREQVRDIVYENYPLQDISELSAILRDPQLRGLNVTIPYKELVIPFLHERNEIVRQINACNCIRIEDGKLFGYNTDAIGFETSLLKKLRPHHTRALILGTGGRAKAVEYVVKKLGIDYIFVTRRPRPSTTDIPYEQVNAEMISSHPLIINTTPLGMTPHTEGIPPLPYAAVTPEHYLFDLIYNPARTLFLQQGEARGAAVENGYEMLILQAEESWRIWQEAPGAPRPKAHH
jgi:shikimate dehydrogenase